MVFLEIGNKRFLLNANSIDSTLLDVDSKLIRIGIIDNSFDLTLEYKTLNAVFFDLGNTLVKTIFDGPNLEGIFLFPETDEIISLLKERGIKIGIISDGSRSQLSEWLNDQNSQLNRLFNKFDTVIMSDDDVGVRKPHKQIFEKALSELDPHLNRSTTAFITDDINHFKVYNLLFIQQLNEISSYV